MKVEMYRVSRFATSLLAFGVAAVALIQVAAADNGSSCAACTLERWYETDAGEWEFVTGSCPAGKVCKFEPTAFIVYCAPCPL